MKNSVIVFGLKTVGKFENEQWSKLGELLEVRVGHNAIIFGSEILIIGGWKNQ